MRSIGPLFGVVQQLEAWTNTPDTANAGALRRAWELLLDRHPQRRRLPGASEKFTGNAAASLSSRYCEPLTDTIRSIIVQAMTDQFDDPPCPGLAQRSLSDVVAEPEFQRHLAFHQQLLSAKLAVAAQVFQTPPLATTRSGPSRPLPQDVRHFHRAHQETRVYLQDELRRIGLDQDDVAIVFLTPHHYPLYRQRIEAMQALVYEPARQTSIEKFDALIQAEHQIAIVVECRQELIAMIFAAPLQHFPDERGLLDDPEFHNPETLYVLDLTVVEAFRGGLGRVLKQAVTLYAACLGLQAIHGRNRDRYARGMWAINLSLGSYPTRFLLDDYPDDLPHRDCIYYRCPLHWGEPHPGLSQGLHSPVRLVDLVDDWQHSSPGQVLGPWMSQALPALVADAAWTIAASRELETLLAQWFGVIPQYRIAREHGAAQWQLLDRCQMDCPQLQRLYAWNVSESAAERLRHWCDQFAIEWVLLTDLSQLWERERVQPTHTSALSALWIEPLCGDELTRLPPETLRVALSEFARRGWPVLFDETAAAWYRYDPQHFLPSQQPTWRPTHSILRVAPGWSLTLNFGKTSAAESLVAESFNDSTQSQESLAAVNELPRQFSWETTRWMLARIEQHRETWAADWSRFDGWLRELLAEHGIVDHSLQRGVGWFAGELPARWASRFQRSPQGRFVVCPAWGDLRILLSEEAHAKP